MVQKSIAICIPCYNEEDNVEKIAEGIIEIFKQQLPKYKYNIQFIDNHSTDQTRVILRKLCAKHRVIRAIFNAKNYPATSGYYGIIQAEGDCVISIPADFQVPLNFIPQMIKEWENGAKIVCLIKTSSKEKKIMWWLRQLYYKIYKDFSTGEVLTNFTGSGLYDKSFLDISREINDPVVSFMQQIVTLGYNIVKLEYRQPERKAGKSKNNFFSYINLAIVRFINATTIVPHMTTVFGGVLSFLSALIALVYLVLKIIFWDIFSAGMAPVLIGIFFIGAVQIFFIGIVLEYIVLANTRLMRRPLVIEEERINFGKNFKK